ncbi:MAG: cobalamin 5'-phosphate synthase [Candidatus Tectomicrobia bacterium RIFCSPLOWO2_12_FULL_69_37]|nr:MAG: cobalamin 5'-phosphate synthase [Candidatus Tectomicrobia bacterium RIFCSPLOWO2_12_FULL_69_37]
MKAFALAVRFLTVIPWPGAPEAPEAGDFAKAVARFPFAGLVLGVLLVLLDGALGLFFPLPVRSAGVVAALALLSGCLHLDGLADWADGMGGGDSPESRLRIMKDSSCGPVGAAAVGLVLLVKYAALVSLHGPGRWQALLVAPILARAAMALLLAFLPYARPEGGTGATFAQAVSPGEGYAAGGWALLFCLVLGGMGGFIAAAGAAALTAGLRSLFRSRLGGGTGDAYGAGGELTEGLALALFAAWWGG